MKQQREQETRQYAEELLKYLEFEDVKDFANLTDKDFTEINFFSENRVSENVTDNESYCGENDLSIEEDLTSNSRSIAILSSSKTHLQTQRQEEPPCARF